MKEMEEFTDVLSPIVLTDKKEGQEKISNYQRKANEAFAFLKQHPPPAEWFKTMRDRDIKYCFEQNKSIREIAVLVKLSETEVLLSLEEMGLVELVGS